MSNLSSQSLRPNRISLLCFAAGVGILAIAAGIRILGALNDLWLDEIWSLECVQEISSPWAVFTGIHHDNNHYLNSLCLYFFGSHGNWPGYRIPSLVAGTGTVVLAWFIGRRRDVPCAFFAMLLVGFSYVMVLYSSEARGYAALVFFSFLAFYALELHLEKPRWPTACLLCFSETMGFLSHLSFFCFFCAVVVWSGRRLAKSNLGFKRVLASLLACHALPLLVFGLLYYIDIRVMVIGGGTRNNWLNIWPYSLVWILGSPVGFPLPAVALLTAAMFGAGLWMLGREHSDLPVFFAGVMVVPLLMIMVGQDKFIYVRYFLVSMAFSLILISFLIARLYQRSPAGKGICLLFLVAYFLANGWHMMTLFRDGRGHYGEAIRFVVEHTKGSTVTMGSDNDFRIPLLLQFYVPKTPKNKSWEYYRMHSWPREGPEWVIYHKESFNEPVPPSVQIDDDAGNQYELVKIFPTAPLSGLHWFVYHNRAK